MPAEPTRPTNVSGEVTSGGPAFESWGPMLSGMQAWTRQLGTVQTAWQREWWGFVEQRLRKDAALPGQLSCCKGPDEALRVCADFYRQAVDDYQRELLTMTRLGADLTLAHSEDVARTDAPEPGERALHVGNL